MAGAGGYSNIRGWSSSIIEAVGDEGAGRYLDIR
jgi:hypothetical protein